MFQHSFMCFTLFYHLFSTCLLPCLPLIVSDTNAVAKIETVWHEKNTLLRVIPAMTFIHFLTGKSSGILSDISSDILFDILSGISSGI